MGNSFDRRERGRWVRSLAAGVVLLSGGAAIAAEDCRTDTILLRGDWGQARFSIEIADDPGERATGLMNRPAMPVSSGMLFIYERPQNLSFWMRNTLIPLDMLFIDAAGVIRHIHHKAIPLDETPINGGGNLTSVLEINGGLAHRLGIVVGTQVRHPTYAQQGAAWPCSE